MDAPEATRRQTNVDKLRAFFLARPGQWIQAEDLEFAGRQAWRSRVSDLRRALERDGQGTIENRTRRAVTVERDHDGPQRMYLGGAVLSEYRYLPHTPLGRDATVPVKDWPVAQRELFAK